MLGTLQSRGAPNFRQVRGGLKLPGMGQPSLLGFRQVLQKLQKDGHPGKHGQVTRQGPVPNLGKWVSRRGNCRGSGGAWAYYGGGGDW